MIAAVLIVLAAVVGFLAGYRSSFSRGVRRGQRLTELAHGWVPALSPSVPKRHGWALLNRKTPEPTGLVTREVSPEHPSFPR